MLGFNSCVTPILFPWVNVVMKDDSEARAFTTGAMMTFGWVFFSFWPITIFPVLEAPKWRKGYTINTIWVVVWWALFMLGQYLWRRDVRAKKFDIKLEEERVREAEQAAMKGEKESMEHLEGNEKNIEQSTVEAQKS